VRLVGLWSCASLFGPAEISFSDLLARFLQFEKSSFEIGFCLSNDSKPHFDGS
jgi:hypothetical protein